MQIKNVTSTSSRFWGGGARKTCSKTTNNKKKPKVDIEPVFFSIKKTVEIFIISKEQEGKLAVKLGQKTDIRETVW